MAVLAALPPFVAPGVRGLLMAVFDPLCHQIPARSFQVGGVPLALCHRCYGIALGVVGGLAVAPLVRARGADGRRGLRLLALAALPMAVDWALGALGMLANTPMSRVLTGAVFGTMAGLVLAGSLRPSVPVETALPEADRG